jgi:hypothetical protein
MSSCDSAKQAKASAPPVFATLEEARAAAIAATEAADAAPTPRNDAAAASAAPSASDASFSSLASAAAASSSRSAGAGVVAATPEEDADSFLGYCNRWQDVVGKTTRDRRLERQYEAAADVTFQRVLSEEIERTRVAEVQRCERGCGALVLGAHLQADHESLCPLAPVASPQGCHAPAVVTATNTAAAAGVNDGEPAEADKQLSTALVLPRSQLWHVHLARECAHYVIDCNGLSCKRSSTLLASWGSHSSCSSQTPSSSLPQSQRQRRLDRREATSLPTQSCFVRPMPIKQADGADAAVSESSVAAASASSAASVPSPSAAAASSWNCSRRLLLAIDPRTGHDSDHNTHYHADRQALEDNTFFLPWELERDLHGGGGDISAASGKAAAHAAHRGAQTRWRGSVARAVDGVPALLATTCGASSAASRFTSHCWR